MPSSRCTSTDRAPQSLADLGIERAERLVEQQHFGLVRERPRHGHALLLSAGELRRQPLVQPFERDQAQQLLPPPAPLRGPHSPHPQREFDVLRHGHVAEERVVLEHQSDAAPPRRHMRHVTAMQRDPPVIQPREPGYRPQQRALAAAAGPEKHEELAVADLERNIVDDRDALIALGQLIESNRHAGSSYRRRRMPSVARRLSPGNNPVTARRNVRDARFQRFK